MGAGSVLGPPRSDRTADTSAALAGMARLGFEVLAPGPLGGPGAGAVRCSLATREKDAPGGAAADPWRDGWTEESVSQSALTGSRCPRSATAPQSQGRVGAA